MSMKPLAHSTVFIANRGEIANRVIQTARRLGMRTAVLHGAMDADLPYVTNADIAVPTTVVPPVAPYLDISGLVKTAIECGADAVHPGYGFLSENAEFAQAVIEAGLIWVGPSPDVIAAMGNKLHAREVAARLSVPVNGATEPASTSENALRQADELGYPVLVKAANGGGGIGMAMARSEDSLIRAYSRVQETAQRNFASPDVFIERYLDSARHVEVQIFGLPNGRVVALGERDCSVQRRNQKIAEESPAPFLTDEVRSGLVQAAVNLGESISYANAGTVEFLVDMRAGTFVFLEMNTRIQVEHPVTELVTGLDLVELQFRVSFGHDVDIADLNIEPSGHAIEARIYAEDSERFMPRPGKITRWTEPAGSGVRVDSGFTSGNEVTPFFDPLLAKLSVHGATREAALERLGEALADFVVEGPETNLPFLRRLVASPHFSSGRYDTGIVRDLQSEALSGKETA
ncbi:acetyl-CoA carboxylase biotin carboxylase subunit [Aeromicrobium piscarium]|nr:biotin carboxylase N-terminal domain-containing protein [Aeromicrobium piscarium]